MPKTIKTQAFVFFFFYQITKCARCVELNNKLGVRLGRASTAILKSCEVKVMNSEGKEKKLYPRDVSQGELVGLQN